MARSCRSDQKAAYSWRLATSRCACKNHRHSCNAPYRRGVDGRHELKFSFAAPISLSLSLFFFFIYIFSNTLFTISANLTYDLLYFLSVWFSVIWRQTFSIPCLPMFDSSFLF